MRDDPFGNERLARWLPVLLRVLVVTVTAYPALRKFLEYSYRVEQFRAYGMPWPELAVPVTGVVELVAIVLIAAGVAGRLGAASLVAVMVVAIVAAGPTPASVLVLVASAALVGLGTGPYSHWDPSLPELVGRLTASGGDRDRTGVGRLRCRSAPGATTRRCSPGRSTASGASPTAGRPSTGCSPRAAAR